MSLLKNEELPVPEQLCSAVAVMQMDFMTNMSLFYAQDRIERVKALHRRGAVIVTNLVEDRVTGRLLKALPQVNKDQLRTFCVGNQKALWDFRNSLGRFRNTSESPARAVLRSDMRALVVKIGWSFFAKAETSTPAYLATQIVRKQREDLSENGGMVAKAEAYLALILTAAGYPDLMGGIEGVSGLSWLSQVRDFKNLNEQEREACLEKLREIFEVGVTDDEWTQLKEQATELASLPPVNELGSGLTGFKSIGVLKEMTLQRFEDCARTLRSRLVLGTALALIPTYTKYETASQTELGSDSPILKKEADKQLENYIKQAREVVAKSVEVREAKERQKKIEEKKLDDALKASEKLKKDENAARELAQIREFHNRPRPVPIPAESETLIENFVKCNPGQHPAAQSSKKNFLDAVALLRDSDYFLDYRGRARDKKGDPAIRELAEKILSTTNLTIVASALENDTGKHFKPHFVPERTPVLQSAEELGKLYVESDAVREQVDEILEELDVAIFVAAAVLPISDVSEFVSFSGSKASDEEKKLRLGEFSERIKNALNHYDEIRTVKSLRVLQNGKGSGNKGKTFDTEIPYWVNKTIGAEYTCFADLNNGLVYVYLNEDPEIFFEVPKSELKSEDRFSKFFAQGLAKAYQTKEYSGLLTELKELGFNVEIETEQTKVSYIECGIKETFRREVSEIKRLRALKEEFEGSQGRAEALKEYAAEVGFRLTETTASGEAKMKLGELAISIPKAITQEIYAELQNTIINELNQYSRSQDLAERRAANLEKERRRAEQEVKPLEGDKILIVDANVLLMWSAPVPGAQDTGRTYLELIKEYASQTGSRIWIPARVLYEVLGDAAFLNSELKLEEVSIRTYPPDTSKPIRAFIEGANHLSMLGSEGTEVSYVAKRGKGSNITIVYTDEDKNFFRNAKQAQEAGRQELFAQNEKKRGLGDNAISDILGLCDVTGCQFDVLTGDATYAQGKMPLKSSNGEDVIWKKPFSVVCSVLDFNAGKALDFPSADESKQAIYDWWQERHENRPGGM